MLLKENNRERKENNTSELGEQVTDTSSLSRQLRSLTPLLYQFLSVPLHC